MRVLALVCLCLFSSLAQAQTLTLGRALDRAKQQHPRLRVAQARLGSAEASVNERESAFEPQIAFEAVAKQGPPGAPNPHVDGLVNSISQRNFGASFVLSYTIMDAGARFHQLLAARHRAEAASWEEAWQRNRIQLAVHQAYYRAWWSEIRQHLAKVDLDRRSRALQVAEARFNAGLASRSDVAAAQAQVSQGRSSLLGAQADCELTRAGLREAVGDPDLSWDTLEEPGQATIAPQGGAADRPDIQALEARLKMAREELQSVQAEDGAILRLVGTAGYINVPGQSYELDNGYGVALVLSWPLFDGGRQNARVSQAAYDVDELAASREELWLTVQTGLTQAQSRLKAQEGQLEELQQQAFWAEDFAKLALLRYQSGVTSILEVTQAQLALTAVQEKLAEARYLSQVYRADLELAQGGW